MDKLCTWYMSTLLRVRNRWLGFMREICHASHQPSAAETHFWLLPEQFPLVMRRKNDYNVPKWGRVRRCIFDASANVFCPFKTCLWLHFAKNILMWVNGSVFQSPKVIAESSNLGKGLNNGSSENASQLTNFRNILAGSIIMDRTANAEGVARGDKPTGSYRPTICSSPQLCEVSLRQGGSSDWAAACTNVTHSGIITAPVNMQFNVFQTLNLVFARMPSSLLCIQHFHVLPFTSWLPPPTSKPPFPAGLFSNHVIHPFTTWNLFKTALCLPPCSPRGAEAPLISNKLQRS